MRKRQFFFCPLPGMPCAGSFPLRASPSRVLRGISRNDAARSALTNGSGLTGEEEIEFDTVDLTTKPSGSASLRAKIQRRSGTASAREMEDTNVFRGEAMLFKGRGMQNRHTLPFVNKSLVYCHLPAIIGGCRKLISATCWLESPPLNRWMDRQVWPGNLHPRSILFCPACSSGHRESRRSAPRGTRRSASFATANALRVWVSKQKSRPKNGRDFSSEPPQKARFRPWERTTLAPSGCVLRQITPEAQRRSKPCRHSSPFKPAHSSTPSCTEIALRSCARCTQRASISSSPIRRTW